MSTELNILNPLLNVKYRKRFSITFYLRIRSTYMLSSIKSHHSKNTKKPRIIYNFFYHFLLLFTLKVYIETTGKSEYFHE